jgi:DNA-binding NtrC family response regulator
MSKTVTQQKSKKAPSKKVIFVVEDDVARQKEIKIALSHQNHWTFEFYATGKEVLDQLDRKPLAVFIDQDHSSIDNKTKDSIKLIDYIMEKDHDSHVIVFSETENDVLTTEALKHGAIDYIVINDHQYIKMENELRWMEGFLEEREENKKFKMYSTLMTGLVILVVGILIYLYYSEQL